MAEQRPFKARVGSSRLFRRTRTILFYGNLGDYFSEVFHIRREVAIMPAKKPLMKPATHKVVKDAKPTEVEPRVVSDEQYRCTCCGHKYKIGRAHV